jgi:nitrite reductase/ring-hydroxylating ferredoxin subunit
MTFGTLAAMMICDQIVGNDNPWADLFDVGRKKLRGGTWDYLKENFDYPYYLIKDRFSHPDAKSTRDVKRGEGRILRENGQWVACSRDDKGKLKKVSATCTHMGCLVRWNDAEKTWDCPCHGSRFQANGKVLAGPAETPLEAVKPAPRAKASS